MLVIGAILTILLVGLKAFNYIGVSWFVAFIPVIIGAVIQILFQIIASAKISSVYKNFNDKW